jgi:hypothetical protein
MRKYNVESDAGECTVNARDHAHALALALPGYNATHCTPVGSSRYYVDAHNHVVTITDMGDTIPAPTMESLDTYAHAAAIVA